MFEIHITCNTTDQELIDDIAREYTDWKTSSIKGDPVLGPETRYYLTSYAKSFPKAYTEMAGMSSILEDNGIAITRQKIELIVFDTKLKDYVLPLYGHRDALAETPPPAPGPAPGPAPIQWLTHNEVTAREILDLQLITLGATYDCQVTGYPKPERRKFARPAVPDERVEALFMGFENMITNVGDPYSVGYLKAMRDEFATLMRSK